MALNLKTAGKCQDIRIADGTQNMIIRDCQPHGKILNQESHPRLKNNCLKATNHRLCTYILYIILYIIYYISYIIYHILCIMCLYYVSNQKTSTSNPRQGRRGRSCSNSSLGAWELIGHVSWIPGQK